MRWFCAAIVVLSGSAFSAAADKDNDQPVPDSFTAVFAEWQGLLSDMWRMQVKYRESDQAGKSLLEARYADLIDNGYVLEGRLRSAAEAEFLSSPRRNTQVSIFLQQLLLQHFKDDRYEEAAALAKVLVDHGVKYRTFLNIAGVSAVCIGDFDSARYLDAAAKSKLELDYKGNSGLEAYVTDTTQQGSAYRGILATLKRNWNTERKIRAAEAKADDLPRVLLKTTKGDITLELFENEAPGTVANFIDLVEKEFYSGMTFHRVLPAYAAQAGCPIGDGSGGPGYTIKDEFQRPDHRLHLRGTVSMARMQSRQGTTAPQSSGSQFFFAFRPTPELDGKYTAFGRVIEGLEVLSRLQRRDPEQKEPPPADKILEAKVLRKRSHEYKPDRAGRP